MPPKRTPKKSKEDKKMIATVAEQLRNGSSDAGKMLQALRKPKP